MDSGLMSEVEATYTCTWTLDAEEIARVRNFSGEDEILAKIESEQEASFGVFVSALPQADDLMRGTSSLVWARDGLLKIARCEILSPVDPHTVVAGDKDETGMDVCDSYCATHGWAKLATLSAVHHLLRENGSLGVHVQFVTFGVKGTPPRLSNDGSSLLSFDQRDFANIVFRFRSLDPSPRYIFAVKEYLIQSCSYFATLFSAGFAEGTDSATLDLGSLPTSSAHNKSFTFDETELRPYFQTARGINKIPAPLTPTRPEPPEAQEDQPHASKRRREDPPDAARPENRIAFIEITETDYTTYRAMLAYLHSPLVPFTALPSDYLVARQAALEIHQSEGSDSSFAFPSPRRWFRDQFHHLVGIGTWQGIKPCSPHAMYRLADCYGIKELREFARDRILRSLTVENVAYELFSPLSFDYDEIQQSILNYFNKNWPEVKESKALDIVLDKFASGDLPQARELIKKVWTRMVPEDTSAVEKNKKKK